MARKPAPALHDVFAKPGAAPSRGTAIEDLPQPAPEPARPGVGTEIPGEARTTAPVSDAPVVELDQPAARHAAPAAAPEAAPPPRMGQPVPPAPPEPPAPAATAAPVRQAEEAYRPPFKTRPEPTPQWGRRALILGLVALVVSLTAPFWEDAVLSMLGIRTPVGRAAEQSTLAVIRQDRRTEDIAQRLGLAMTQMTRQQAEFTSAMQRADRSAMLIRTMALVRLSDTLRRPMPFAAELAVVQASGTDLGDLKPLLAQIEPYANTGVPGTTQLRQEFRTLYEQVTHGGSASSSWVGNLATWTHLRGATPAQPTSDPSLELLRTASLRLGDIDIPGALEATLQISETYKPAFANWIDDAQARVAADTLAERVGDMVTQALRPPASK
jgi:hypothetical protein